MTRILGRKEIVLLIYVSDLKDFFKLQAHHKWPLCKTGIFQILRDGSVDVLTSMQMVDITVLVLILPTNEMESTGQNIQLTFDQ